MISKWFQTVCKTLLKLWWLIAAYTLAAIVYGVCVFPLSGNELSFPNVLIAPIMMLGSFVAGSTFLGGGAVAFPVMTKWLMISPVLAKQFALAIQSVGMTSASIFIFLKMKEFPWNIYLYYLLASCIGTFLSISLLQSIIPTADIKIGFTLFVLCFYAVFVYARRKNYDLGELILGSKDKVVLLVAGLLGGLLSGLIGSGADLILFCVLNLYFHLSFKISTLLSIVAMAGTSLFGIAIIVLTSGVQALVIDLWVIAAPVVIIGAPLGTWVCMKVSEKKLFWFMSIIVLIEVISSLFLVSVELSKIKYFILLSVSCLFSLQYLLYIAEVRQSDALEADAN